MISLVSFANFKMVVVMLQSKSFMKIVKNTGTKTDPWGTLPKPFARVNKCHASRLVAFCCLMHVCCMFLNKVWVWVLTISNSSQQFCHSGNWTFNKVCLAQKFDIVEYLSKTTLRSDYHYAETVWFSESKWSLLLLPHHGCTSTMLAVELCCQMLI